MTLRAVRAITSDSRTADHTWQGASVASADRQRRFDEEPDAESRLSRSQIRGEQDSSRASRRPCDPRSFTASASRRRGRGHPGSISDDGKKFPPATHARSSPERTGRGQRQGATLDEALEGSALKMWSKGRVTLHLRFASGDDAGVFAHAGRDAVVRRPDHLLQHGRIMGINSDVATMSALRRILQIQGHLVRMARIARLVGRHRLKHELDEGVRCRTRPPVSCNRARDAALRQPHGQRFKVGARHRRRERQLRSALVGVATFGRASVELHVHVCTLLTQPDRRFARAQYDEAETGDGIPVPQRSWHFAFALLDPAGRCRTTR